RRRGGRTVARRPRELRPPTYGALVGSEANARAARIAPRLARARDGWRVGRRLRRRAARGEGALERRARRRATDLVAKVPLRAGAFVGSRRTGDRWAPASLVARWKRSGIACRRRLHGRRFRSHRGARGTSIGDLVGRAV